MVDPACPYYGRYRLSWANSNPGLNLAATKAQGLTGLSAQCAYYAEDLEEASSEPLLVSVESDPLVALEQYARKVCQANNPPIREDTIMGWLSWYCSRLAMTEDFVLGNAKVLAERFCGYGVGTMQVDHGWEYRDVAGNWVANERFPQGLRWLSDELGRLDLKLGIWIAASCVSEHTLSGAAVRTPGERGTICVHVPEGYEPIKVRPLTPDRVLAVPVEFTQDEVAWDVAFRASGRAGVYNSVAPVDRAKGT